MGIIMKFNKVIAGISALTMLTTGIASVSASSVEETPEIAPAPVITPAEDAEAPKPPVIDEEEEAAKKAEREAKRAEDEAKREAEKAEREAKRAEDEAKREAEKAEREAKREAEKAEREAKRAEDEAKREAEKAEREANKPAPPAKPDDAEKPEPPAPPVKPDDAEKPELPTPPAKPDDAEKPEAPKPPVHCHKINDLIDITVDQIYDVTEDMDAEQVTGMAEIAIPLLMNMDKEDIKKLARDVLADGVVDASDMVSIRNILAQTAEA